MQSFDLIQLLRTVVNQAARKLAAVQINTAYAISDAEGAPDFFDAGRKQTLPFVHHRVVRSGINHHVPRRLEVVSDPMLAVGQAILIGKDQSPGCLPRVEDLFDGADT